MMMMGKGLQRGKESEDEEFFDTSDIWSPEDTERALIRKNIQTDKVLDLIAKVPQLLLNRLKPQLFLNKQTCII